MSEKLNRYSSSRIGDTLQTQDVYLCKDVDPIIEENKRLKEKSGMELWAEAEARGELEHNYSMAVEIDGTGEALLSNMAKNVKLEQKLEASERVALQLRDAISKANIRCNKDSVKIIRLQSEADSHLKAAHVLNDRNIAMQDWLDTIYERMTQMRIMCNYAPELPASAIASLNVWFDKFGSPIKHRGD